MPSQMLFIEPENLMEFSTIFALEIAYSDHWIFHFSYCLLAPHQSPWIVEILFSMTKTVSLDIHLRWRNVDQSVLPFDNCLHRYVEIYTSNSPLFIVFHHNVKSAFSSVTQADDICVDIESRNVSRSFSRNSWFTINCREFYSTAQLFYFPLFQWVLVSFGGCWHIDGCDFLFSYRHGAAFYFRIVNRNA